MVNGAIVRGSSRTDFERMWKGTFGGVTGFFHRYVVLPASRRDRKREWV